MLCRKCKHSQVIEFNNGSEEIYCMAMPETKRLTKAVQTCNQYSNVMQKDEYELRQIAWILEVNKGQVIGFRKPRNERR